MAQRTENLYQNLVSSPPAPRSFVPADLDGTTPEVFGAIMDQVLSTEPLTCQDQFNQLPQQHEPSCSGVWCAPNAHCRINARDCWL